MSSPGRKIASMTSMKAKTRFVIDNQELSENFVIRQQYDPQQTFRNVLTFRGTVVEMVFQQRHFWLLVIKHALLFLGWKYASDELREEVHELWNLRPAYFSALGGLVVFMIVFYTGNCYALYKELFDLGIAFQLELVAIATQMKGALHMGDQVWAVVRCFLAAQRVYYYELKINLAKHHGLREGEEGHPAPWSKFAEEHLIQRQILTTAEAETVRGFDGDKPMLLASWAVSAYISFFKSNPRCMPLGPNLGFAIGRLQASLLKTTATKQFGVPFVYHHIVHMTCTLYLIVQSIQSLFVEPDGDYISYWSMISYPIICFVILGMLSAADAMADPFGDDECDFNLDALTEKLFADLARLCALDDSAVLAINPTEQEPLCSPLTAAISCRVSTEIPGLLNPADVPGTTTSGDGPAGLSVTGTPPRASAEFGFVVTGSPGAASGPGADSEVFRAL